MRVVSCNMEQPVHDMKERQLVGSKKDIIEVYTQHLMFGLE